MWIPTVDNSAKTPFIHNMQEALNDIRDFQDRFVQRYNADVAKRKSMVPRKAVAACSKQAISVSHTPAKSLGLRGSQDYGQLDHIGSINHAASDGAAREGNSALDYNVKIQNETITSQYTLLRLRFNGGENSMGGVGGFEPGRRSGRALHHAGYAGAQRPTRNSTCTRFGGQKWRHLLETALRLVMMLVPLRAAPVQLALWGFRRDLPSSCGGSLTARVPTTKQV